MQSIIAGRFESMSQADSTAALLTDYIIHPEDICIFYNTPPLQHNSLQSEGDEENVVQLYKFVLN